MDRGPQKKARNEPFLCALKMVTVLLVRKRDPEY